MDLKIAGDTAVVTGGASGIGLAIAKTFLNESCRLALWDQSAEVETVGRSLETSPDRSALGIPTDITSETDLQAALTTTLDAFGRVDHLVHCAAIGSGKFGFPFTNLTPADWSEVLRVNIMGMTNVAHVVTPHMVENGAGTMVFLASVAGQIGSPTDPPYSASKAANINFAQCMAKDLASEGVRVNTVCPGMVQTPLNRAVWQAWNDQQPSDHQRSYEDWAGEKIRQVVPLGQWQQPEDIANMVVFLSSPRTASVTGQTINVDGGFVMHW